MRLWNKKLEEDKRWKSLILEETMMINLAFCVYDSASVDMSYEKLVERRSENRKIMTAKKNKGQ